jgi:hypothetical protein
MYVHMYICTYVHMVYVLGLSTGRNVKIYFNRNISPEIYFSILKHFGRKFHLKFRPKLIYVYIKSTPGANPTTFEFTATSPAL